MNLNLKKVEEFHETFGHPINNSPNGFESQHTRKLRISLLFEELKELAEASDCLFTFNELCEKSCNDLTDYCISFDSDLEDGDNVNKIEELDALCDIQYVLNGKILTAGFKDIFDREYDVVHENNMNKAHSTKEEAEKTLNRKNDLGEPIMDGYIQESNGKFLVKSYAGKLIKPYNHTKVKLDLNVY